MEKAGYSQKQNKGKENGEPVVGEFLFRKLRIHLSYPFLLAFVFLKGVQVADISGLVVCFKRIPCAYAFFGVLACRLEISLFFFKKRHFIINVVPFV